MRIVFLSRTDFGVVTLEALLQRRELVEVAAVVPGDELVKNRAKEANLQILDYGDINSGAFVSEAGKLHPDLFVNVMFLKKYGSSALRVPRLGVINVHPSKLPYYRGRDCIRWAMMYGEREVGISIHMMDESLDTGEIILQEIIPIRDDENFTDVREKVKTRYPGMVIRAIENLSIGNVAGVKQDPTQGNYFPHRTPLDSKVNWMDSSLSIHNFVRANYEPGFYSFSYLRERKVYVHRTKIRTGNPYERLLLGGSKVCGRVLDFDANDKTESAVLVGTGDGALSVESCSFDEAKQERARDVLKRGDVLS